MDPEFKKNLRQMTLVKRESLPERGENSLGKILS